MKVSQYIYTACGKERTGAFSVFSKSKDITEAESAEIREVMMYKAPPGLPYEPTEQQIEELWPKKFGYFFLSSGRACLAHVCYVGRVYSDLDGRSGNYIIHAFVFNKTNDFVPYSFIEHTVFKRLLTKKEWHDDPIPDELPQIDIPATGGPLQAGEISSFLNDDRKNKLKLLIEAISSAGEKPVFYFDEPNNHKFWFKLLSVCLPAAMQNAMSICTHFTNTLVPGNASSRIQIRVNQPDGFQFNYAMEAQKGNYAFDFVKNIIPGSVKPGKFAESVVTLVSSGAFEAEKFVDNINKIMSGYSVNINEAADLINIGKTEYSSFANGDEIHNAVMLADRVNYEIQLVAKNLLAKWEQLGFSAQQKLDILAFIYKNIQDARLQIIKKIVEGAEQFGIRIDEPAAFRDDLNSKAKFIFANYADYLKKEGIANYVTQNQNSFHKLFLAFDNLVLPAAKNPTSEEMTAVKNILAAAFKRQSLADIDLLINAANARNNGLGISLLAVIVKSPLASGNGIPVKFAFDILKRVAAKSDVAYAYLLTMIKTMFDQDGFVNAYTSAQNASPDFYEKFESDNKKEPVVIEFCKKKDMYRFESQPLDMKALKDFFEKYYVTGADKVLFVKRLGEYLSKAPPEKRANECVSVLDKLKFPANADKAIIPPVYNVVLESVFSLPYDKVYDLCKKQDWLDRIDEMYTAITAAKLKPETRDMVIITLCGKAIEKSGFNGCEPAELKEMAAKFELLASGKSIDTFIDYYFQPVLNSLIIWTTDKNKPFKQGGDAEKMFAKIIEKGTLAKLTEQIVAGLRKAKTNSFLTIAYLFRKHLASSPNTLDKKLGDIAEDYFIRFLEKSGDRKRSFSELLKLAQSEDEAKQFQQYFDDFNKKYKPKGFFGF